MITVFWHSPQGITISNVYKYTKHNKTSFGKVTTYWICPLVLVLHLFTWMWSIMIIILKLRLHQQIVNVAKQKIRIHFREEKQKQHFSRFKGMVYSFNLCNKRKSTWKTLKRLGWAIQIEKNLYWRCTYVLKHCSLLKTLESKTIGCFPLLRGSIACLKVKPQIRINYYTKTTFYYYTKYISIIYFLKIIIIYTLHMYDQ